jgi:hypothetical protein
MLAYYVQELVTGKGPVENWASHAAAPFSVNGSVEDCVMQLVPGSVAMFASGGIKAELANWRVPN